jgi:hypothetical protein
LDHGEPQPQHDADGSAHADAAVELTQMLRSKAR